MPSVQALQPPWPPDYHPHGLPAVLVIIQGVQFISDNWKISVWPACPAQKAHLGIGNRNLTGSVDLLSKYSLVKVHFLKNVNCLVLIFAECHCKSVVLLVGHK